MSGKLVSQRSQQIRIFVKLFVQNLNWEFLQIGLGLGLGFLIGLGLGFLWLGLGLGFLWSFLYKIWTGNSFK